MTDLRSQLSDALAGRYTLDRQLGRGGMATVFLAQDLKHDRPVALKVLHPELATALGPERFQREIKLAARLQHPHVLTVLDSGESVGQLWFTMPFVEGESLRDRLNRERQLPVDDAIRIVREAAQGLEYAHQHGVVHRDIKPENILLTADGSTLVADFGIARTIRGEGEQLTQTGMAIGTPAYMSPEQATGERGLDPRSDVYALGCVLYELLAGELPFTGPTAQAVLMRAMTETARPIHANRAAVSPALDATIARAMARTPADRFESMAEFARTLESNQRSARRTGEHRVSTPIATQASQPNRRRISLMPVLALGFLLGLGVLFAWKRSRDALPAIESGAKLIAVLPFENQGDSADEYFADGITDEVRGKLATLPGLQVIAGSSASQYKRSSKTAQQIATELGVQYLLVGKIRWEKTNGSSSRVRVSPELIQVGAGSAPTTRWQQPFDAALTDVFQVQADIAGRVAQALNLALASGVQQQLNEKPTQNLAAYDAYLRGIEALSQGGAAFTLRPAASSFEQAVALDTSFAAAWAGLSQALSLLNASIAPSAQMAERSRTAAERALALAPDRPEGFAALGDYYRRTTRDNPRALEEYARGLRLAPGNAALLRGTALVELAMNRMDAAIGHFQEAQRLDPRSNLTATALTGALHYARRYAEALQAADVSLSLVPTNLQNIETKLMIYLSQGDRSAAESYLQNLPKDIEPTALAAYVATYYDLYWILSPEQQSLLLRLSPSQFEDDRGSWGLALAATYALRGTSTKSRVYADSARIAFEDQLGASDDPQLHVLLGTALAYLGRAKDAIREGERAVELLPVSRSLIGGAYNQHQLARIYILVGEPEKAIDQLESLLKVPYLLSPGWLKIDPTFDPLRKNPRFQKLLTGS